MTTNVKAIFEGGLLRPLQPLDLAEGQEVEVIAPLLPERTGPDPEYIEQLLAEFAAANEPKGGPEASSTAPDPRRAAEILAAIAAMPMESRGAPFSGEDHDRILYGEHGAR